MCLDLVVTFISTFNESTSISAPLNQKFVCKDRLNITLKNLKYENIVIEFLPEIDIQPVNTGSGFGSNSMFIHFFVIFIYYFIKFLLKIKKKTMFNC